jgi:zinc protease
VTQSEVDKARNNILSDATYKLETVQGQAHAVGYFSASTGDPHWDKVYNRAVQSVTPGDVLRVARKYLIADTVQAVAMPGTEGAPGEGLVLTGEQLLAEVREILTMDPNAALSLRTPDVIDGIERIDLPSGDVLLVQPDRGVPVIGLRVAALGGLRGETAEVSGRAHLMAQMLMRGTARRSSHEIAHEIETLAAGLGGFTGRNSIGMHAVSLAHAKDAVLDLLFDALFEASLPSAELEHERAVQLEDLRHQADAPARLALRAMASALYGNHPYGLDILGTPESVAALDRDELQVWLRRQLAPGRLVYAAVGDVDPGELAESITARTPSDRTPLEQLHPQAVEALPGVVQLRPTAEKQQAHIALGFRATTLYKPDRFALDVLSTILSGQSGRLFLELRDKQSLAYTVSSMHVDGLDEGYFALYIGTSPDKAEQALAGLRVELDKVLQGPVSAEELDRARRYLAGGHAIGLQRRSARASTICLNELYGLGRHAYRGQLANLLAVTADDILKAAREYLTLDRHVEVVLAPGVTATTQES